MAVSTNYISTISSIDDALEDLEEELLTITDENDIGIQIERRATNAAAESFNAKIKAFRAQFRGVRDKAFFLYRLAKLYA